METVVNSCSGTDLTSRVVEVVTGRRISTWESGISLAVSIRPGRLRWPLPGGRGSMATTSRVIRHADRTLVASLDGEGTLYKGDRTSFDHGGRYWHMARDPVSPRCYDLERSSGILNLPRPSKSRPCGLITAVSCAVTVFSQTPVSTLRNIGCGISRDGTVCWSWRPNGWKTFPQWPLLLTATTLYEDVGGVIASTPWTRRLGRPCQEPPHPNAPRGRVPRLPPYGELSGELTAGN